MAWYRTGTISIPSGSKTITGVGTTFNDTAAGVSPGDMVIVEGQFLEVATVNSATSITTVNASTAVVSGATYQIVTTVQMTNASLAKKISAAMDRIISGISNWMLIFKGSGPVTITNYDGSEATGLAWPTITSMVRSALLVNDAQLTSMNGQLDNGQYTVASGATGIPTGVTTGGMLENIKYGTIGYVQTFRTATATSGQLNRTFARYGLISGGNVTWTAWTETFGTNSIIPIASGGTGSSTPFGTAANTFAQGNDGRLNTVNNKSGGTISSLISVTGDVLASQTFGDSNQGRWSAELRAVLPGWGQPNGAPSGVTGAYFGFATISPSAAGAPVQGQLTGSSYWHGTKRWYFPFDTGNAIAPGTWVSNSDERIKTNIQRVADPLQKMVKLKGVTWERLDNAAPGIGFIAQHVQEVFPDSVFTSGDRTLKDGTVVKDILSPDTSGVSAALHHEAILSLMGTVKMALSLISDGTDDAEIKKALAGLADSIPDIQED